MLSAQDADRLLREGVAAMQRADGKAARRLFEQVAAAGNGIAPPWLLIAQACRLERDQDAELAALDRLLAEQPRHLRGLIMKGDVMGRRGDLRAAHSFYRVAVGVARNTPNLPPNLASYGADSLWNYELGFKGGWFDNRLLASAAVYRIDWSDMQYTANSTNGAFSFITNLGRARVYGMEAETTFILSPQLRGGANLSLTDAVLTKDQASNDGIGLGAAGDRMPVVPRVAGDGWVEYRRETPWGAELMLRADASYVGTSHSTFKGGSAGDQKLGGMWLFNARAILKARN